MNKKVQKLLVLISLVFIGELPYAAGSGMVVVVSPNSPIKNVSETDIRNLYLGKIKQIDGVNAIPVNMPGNSRLREEFEMKLLGKNSRSMQEYWQSQKLQGNIREPKAMPSKELAIKALKRVERAIGYVDRQSATGLRILLEL